MLYTTLILIAVISIGAAIILNLPSFGKTPSGERLARIQQSPNYREGKFQNLEPTPELTSNDNILKTAYHYFFPNVQDLNPSTPIPAVQTDLRSLPNNAMVWFGHSSYLLNVNNTRVLVDPVFHSASPFSFMVKPFKATYNYSAADMPDTIEVLVLTHDHWDHLDYDVVKALQPRVKKAYMGLGVGAHFERWGYRPEQIVELDWNESAPLTEGGHIHCLPTQHFSGRGLTSGQSLWASFLVEGREHSVYIGGDGGGGRGCDKRRGT